MNILQPKSEFSHFYGNQLLGVESATWKNSYHTLVSSMKTLKKNLVCQDSWKLVQLFQCFIYLIQIFVSYHAAVENVSAKVTTLQWVEIIFKEFKLPGISWYIWFNQYNIHKHFCDESALNIMNTKLQKKFQPISYFHQKVAY